MDERATLHAAAWAIAAVAAVLLVLRLISPAPAPPRAEVQRVGEQDAGTRSTRAARTGPYVHVAGAVRRPGLYRLADGARAANAVRRAGGATPQADLTAINLAAPLQDGQQVIVPRLVHAAGAGQAGPAATISLGTATVEQLDELDGIGPTLAERIVELRQERGGFSSLDQLGEVDGIGAKRLEALKAALSP